MDEETENIYNLNTLHNLSKSRLKAISHNLKAAVLVGKNGLTDSVIEEIKAHLRKKNIIKVKVFGNFISALDEAGKTKKSLFTEIAEKTGSILVHKVGFTVTLLRKLKSHENH